MLIPTDINKLLVYVFVALFIIMKTIIVRKYVLFYTYL